MKQKTDKSKLTSANEMLRKQTDHPELNKKTCQVADTSGSATERWQ